MKQVMLDSSTYIKVGEPKDQEAIIDMINSLTLSGPYKDKKLNYDSLDSIVSNCIYGDKSQHISIVLVYEDYPHGVLLATKLKHPFFEEDVVTELCWWVDKECRRGSVSLGMIDALEAWAKLVGASTVQMMTTSNEDRVGILYERRGYDRVETSYIKDIK